MSSRIAIKNQKLCRSCRTDSAYFVEGEDYCKNIEPLCGLVDRRLAELAFEERGKLPLAELQEMSRTIMEGHAAMLRNIEAELIALPGSPVEFRAFVLSAHQTIFGGTRLRYAGSFRHGDVSFGSGRNLRNGVAPSQIELKLEAFYNDLQIPSVDDLRTITEHLFLRLCARFLEGFFHIHPFYDGNGRIGRLFLNLIATKSQKFRFRSFTDAGQTEKYVDALEFAHRHATPSVPGENAGGKKDPYCHLVKWLAGCLDREFIASANIWGEQRSEAEPPLV